jgi:hypothetical protein
MENIIEFLKKHKTKLLVILVLFFFFKSCGSSRNLDKQEKTNKQQTQIIDSLTLVTKTQKDLIKNEKIKVHTFYDNWISEKNRSPQLMELHSVVKDNIRKEEESK